MWYHTSLPVFTLVLPFVSLFSSQISVIAQSTNETGPIVNLTYGSLQGTTSGNVTTFLGMPYAAPPIGDLRFAPPQPPTPFNDTRSATDFGAACFQQRTKLFPDIPLPPNIPGFGTIKNMSEDCLFINVVRPTNVSNNTQLPVLFWIVGGGFERGDTSQNPGNTVVERSIALGQPIIYVSANYRVTALGFLGGSEIQQAGLGNIGLRDQRFALEWVQQHISAFGGNPSNVTIWGESAGAISVGLQMVANNGNSSGLFHGAFMQSGSPIPLYNTSSQQFYFNQLVSNTNCNSASDKISCLRSVPFDDLTNAIAMSPGLYSYQSLQLAWQPSVDGVFITRDPQFSVMDGEFARVPFVTGDCDDEGTIFSLANLNISTNEEFLQYMATNYLSGITNQELNDLSEAYPQDITQGSPFDTGYRNALTRQYKRLAAVQGDLIFQAPRRWFLRNAAFNYSVPTYAFLYRRGKSRAFLGSYHGSDVAEFYATGNSPDFIVNFVNTLDPNTPPSTPQPPAPDSPPSLLSNITWPRWDNSSNSSVAPPILAFLDPAPSVEVWSDTFRQEPMWLLTNLSLRLEGVSH
ncbi:hypothetical protein AX16_006119 [Volvariella volvacea WC 439]|nr:hypothetical protein AX16_006119 [Volvariella volvacea WC 439]